MPSRNSVEPSSSNSQEASASPTRSWLWLPLQSSLSRIFNARVAALSSDGPCGLLMSSATGVLMLVVCIAIIVAVGLAGYYASKTVLPPTVLISETAHTQRTNKEDARMGQSKDVGDKVKLATSKEEEKEELQRKARIFVRDEAETTANTEADCENWSSWTECTPCISNVSSTQTRHSICNGSSNENNTQLQTRRCVCAYIDICDVMEDQSLTGYDSDKCDRNDQRCPNNSVCVNTRQTYDCHCILGYEWKSSERECVDIDECESQLHDCDADSMATCINTPGSYKCVCRNNSEGDGHYCAYANKTCEELSMKCPEDKYCAVITYDMFVLRMTKNVCVCQHGYRYNSEDEQCHDINECVSETALCSKMAECTNQKPHYNCHCKPGYEGNGVYCRDINECADSSHRCSAHAHCVNTAGSYVCVCAYGYIGDGFTCARICQRKYLPVLKESIVTHSIHNVDVNGCASNPCQNEATCQSNMTSFQCLCREGFHGEVCEHIFRGKLYPYGTNAGDQMLCRGAFLFIKQVIIKQGLQFMRQRYKEIRVDVNGFITFGHIQYSKFSSNVNFTALRKLGLSIMTPLWTNLSALGGCEQNESVVFHHVYVRDASSQVVDDATYHVLKIAKQDAGRHANDVTYNPSMIVVITWHKMTPAANREKNAGHNTFQLVLMSDHYRYRTYAVFAYENVSWGVGNLAIGYSTSMDFFTKVAKSYDWIRPGISLADTIGNTGERGRWLERLTTDQTEEVAGPAYICRRWLVSQLDILLLHKMAAMLPRCPCRWNETLQKTRTFDINWRSHCAISRPLAGRKFSPAQECCYNRYSSTLKTKPDSESGSMFLFHPRVHRVEHFNEDHRPKTACCTNPVTCKLFYRYRPLQDCRRSRYAEEE